MAVAVIIVPDDFSAKAYMRVRRSLADSGMKTIVACAGEKRDLTSSNGKKTIQPKWNVAQTYKRLERLSAVCVIGGKGATRPSFFRDDELRSLLMRCPNESVAVGGIGKGMLALGEAFLLTSTEVSDIDTGKSSEKLKKRIEGYGAILTDGHAALIDGFVVTAAGPSYGDDFAAGILEIVEENT